MNKIKLGDVLEVKRGMSLPGEYYATEGDYIRLTLGNFNYPSCGWKKNVLKDNLFFTGNVRDEYIIKKGDIITPLTEQVRGLLGNTATIPEDALYIQSGDIGLIIPDETKLDKRFSYYLVSSSVVKKQLDARSQQTKIRHTSPEAIKDCVAFIPIIKEQKKISYLLDCINKKIENNNAINDNLQQQIRLLYNYWFTQFDFPDKNGNPYKSSGGTMVWSPIIHRDIPVYWKVTKLLDIVSWESNSQPPKSEFIYEPKDGYIRFIQNRDYDSDNHQTYIPYTKNLSTVDRFDILMDKYGDAGAVRYGIEGAFNVALGKINVNRPNFQEYIRSFLESDGVYSYLHNSCMASTRASLNESNLSMLNVVIPDEDTLSAFQLQIRKIRESILLTNDENLQLENLRNWLLPMLMNGQAVIQD